MGLHVLQEIVIKLELDSTSSTGVRLCLGEMSSEELHRVCREAAQVHTSVCTAVGHSTGSRAGLCLLPGAGLAWAGHLLLLLHFIHCQGQAEHCRKQLLLCVGTSGMCTRVSSGWYLLVPAAFVPVQSLLDSSSIQSCQIPVSAAFPE